MTRADLTNAEYLLEQVAEKHGCVLKVVIGSPCTDDELLQLARFTNNRIPSSLESFLKEHNGYSLTMHDKREYDPFGHSLAYHKLMIHSSSDIMKMTLNLRTYPDFELDSQIARTKRCFEFARLHGPLNRLVFSQDNETSGGEYAIFTIDLDEADWIEELVAPKSIATSVDDFIERAIHCMIEKELTFAYWDKTNTEVWPEPSSSRSS